MARITMWTAPMRSRAQSPASWQSFSERLAAISASSKRFCCKCIWAIVRNKVACSLALPNFAATAMASPTTCNASQVWPRNTRASREDLNAASSPGKSPLCRASAAASPATCSAWSKRLAEQSTWVIRRMVDTSQSREVSSSRAMLYASCAKGSACSARPAFMYHCARLCNSSSSYRTSSRSCHSRSASLATRTAPSKFPQLMRAAAVAWSAMA
mmetsp:Transcript_60578/g.175413  ORF Transcript_60578/g.175413 Transcript_60578/m.175413 type:complete len:214 (-) Transcript_60578:186-827(-)